MLAGHPDFHIHSGEAAVIEPQQVAALSRHRGAAVAVAKHHTVIATSAGEVFTWGNNREGRLGYPSVDTQPTPRRYTSMDSQHVSILSHTAPSTNVLS